MSKGKWTKGPWERRGRMVYTVASNPGEAIHIADCDTIENADLIAEAPAMADLLGNLVECAESCEPCKGSGASQRDPKSACSACGGYGEVVTMGAIQEVIDARAILARINGEGE